MPVIGHKSAARSLPWPDNMVQDLRYSSPDTVFPFEKMTEREIQKYYIEARLLPGWINILKARYQEQLTYAAIGERFGITLDRVRSIIQKSLWRMRSAIDSETQGSS